MPVGRERRLQLVGWALEKALVCVLLLLRAVPTNPLFVSHQGPQISKTARQVLAFFMMPPVADRHRGNAQPGDRVVRKVTSPTP